MIDIIHSQDDDNLLGIKRKASKLVEFFLGGFPCLEGMDTYPFPSLASNTSYTSSDTSSMVDPLHEPPLSSTTPTSQSTNHLSHPLLCFFTVASMTLVNNSTNTRLVADIPQFI